MLHQSVVIMTSVRQSVLFQPGERDGKQREGETLQEHSGSLIQMTALNQRAFFQKRIPASGEFLCYNHRAVVLTERIAVLVMGSTQTQALKVWNVIIRIF